MPISYRVRPDVTTWRLNRLISRLNPADIKAKGYYSLYKDGSHLPLNKRDSMKLVRPDRLSHVVGPVVFNRTLQANHAAVSLTCPVQVFLHLVLIHGIRVVRPYPCWRYVRKVIRVTVAYGMRFFKHGDHRAS